MARQEKRTARKDYPREGIAKGDTYYYAKIKTGQRSSMEIRSKTPIPQSRMTVNPYRSPYLAMVEGWNDGDRDEAAIRDAAETIRDLGNEQQEKFDNMPQGLQQGETGQMLESRAQALSDKADELDTLADELEALGDQPEDPGEGPDADDYEEEGGYDEAQQAHDEAVTAFEEWESERDRIVDEADSLIQDMPE